MMVPCAGIRSSAANQFLLGDFLLRLNDNIVIADCQLPIADLFDRGRIFPQIGNRQLAIDNIFELVQKSS